MPPTLLLALACHGPPAAKPGAWPPPDDSAASTDTGTSQTYTSYTGTARYRSGWQPTPGVFDCDLRWDTVGTPTDACPDCIWTFEVSFTYDATNSVDDADCTSSVDDTDWTWDLGLTLDGYGYGVPILWYYMADYGYWYPAFASDWSAPDVAFSGGVYQEAYSYEDGIWYYTTYWSGEATVQ